MSTPIFKNDVAKGRMMDWYGRFLGRIKKPSKSLVVRTSLGESHVLFVGDPANPPVVCLHAMLTSSAHLLSELCELANDFYLIAPDLPGQSAKGLNVRLPYSDNSHSNWLGEVLDGLNLEQVHLLGVSLGGFVARQYAAQNPEKVVSLTLIVPAGIVQGSLLKGFSKMAWPMIRYKMRQNEKNLYALVDNLVTTRDEEWAQYIGDSFMDFNPNLKIPPLATDQDLEKLTMPVLLIGAEHDISFPGQALIDRLQGVVPNLETELIIGGKHSPPTTSEFRSWLHERFTKFVKT